MEDRNNEIINFDISYDENFIKKLRPIPHELDVQLPNLYKLALKGKKSGIKRLEKLISTFPNEPMIKNYLSVLYNSMGNIEKSREINREIVEKHPDYLFGKLNLASEYYYADEFEKMTEILGANFNLKELYPERDTFHIVEVEGMLKMAGMYYIGIHDFEKARTYIEIAYELDLEDLKDLLRTILAQKILEKNVLQKEKNIDVIVKPTVLSNKTTPPTFSIKEIEKLYEYGLDIDISIIEDILKSNRNEIIEDLNKVLKDSIERYQFFTNNDPDTSVNSNLSFPLHALIILAELEASESLDNVLEFLSQDYDFIDFYFGDLITEFIWMTVYKIGHKKLATCIDFLKKPGIETFHKTAVLEVFLQVALHQPERKKDIIEYYRDLLNFFLDSKLDDNVIDSSFIGMLISDILDIGAKELLPEIELLYKKEYVDISVCGDLPTVRKDINKPIDIRNKKEILDIYKMYEDLDSWYSYFDDDIEDDEFETDNDSIYNENFVKNYEEDHGTFIRKSPKIGRNEPCPCGSGKKYKKCCMNK